MDKFIIELHGHKIIVILNINKYHIDWSWSQILLQSPLWSPPAWVWLRILWFIIKGWSVFCIWTDPLKWRWRGARNTLIPRADINRYPTPRTGDIFKYLSSYSVSPQYALYVGNPTLTFVHPNMLIWEKKESMKLDHLNKPLFLSLALGWTIWQFYWADNKNLMSG